MSGPGGNLAALVLRAREAHPDRVAVVHPGREQVTYRELFDRVVRLEEALRRHGVGPGDRVGLCLPKSVTSVAAILATLRCGAAYVPVGWHSPAARNAFIFEDCAVRVLLAEPHALEPLVGAMARPPQATEAWSEEAHLVRFAVPAEAPPAPPDLAYVLYTSGSTGTPKGVMISHQNAVAFVRWSWEVLDLGPEDRFSSHAPFHFDLSIFDLYACLGQGAALVLIGEEEGRQPRRLAPLIAEQAISVWYSTPSILALLAEHGRLERHDWSALRAVLFAGEVFPVKHLRALQRHWPGPRYQNWYGPTETNVCTWYEVPVPVPADREEPYPIGRPCSHVHTRVVRPDGGVAAPGEEGELEVRGAPVMAGYWNLPERTAEAFVADEDGARWYRTGDLVREDGDAGYVFVGRRDRMVKRRGFRVELGEVEGVASTFGGIGSVCVVPVPHEELTNVLVLFVVMESGALDEAALRAHLAAALPRYMLPEAIVERPALPLTGTQKVDRRALAEAAASAVAPVS